MKKQLYYATPFVIVPIIFLSMCWLDRIDTVANDVLLICVIGCFFLFSAVMGSLSPTEKRFDFMMTLITPLSLFIALFIGLFFDRGCDGLPQLSLHHALNVEYYRSWLPIAIMMAIITFAASFKPIRFIKKFGRVHKKAYE